MGWGGGGAKLFAVYISSQAMYLDEGGEILSFPVIYEIFMVLLGVLYCSM